MTCTMTPREVSWYTSGGVAGAISVLTLCLPVLPPGLCVLPPRPGCATPSACVCPPLGLGVLPSACVCLPLTLTARVGFPIARAGRPSS